MAKGKQEPMLAAEFEESKILVPAYIQPKWDGWRLLAYNSQPLSRTFKAMKNPYVQGFYKEFGPYLNGLDGEALVGDPEKGEIRNCAALNAHTGEPDFTWMVFDSWAHQDLPYDDRLEIVKEQLKRIPAEAKRRVMLCETELVTDVSRVWELEEKYLLRGLEGAIYRKRDGKYKWGRSTANQGYLIKIKRFVDGEAEVIGFNEKYSNQNEPQQSLTGHQVRSSHKANKIPLGTLGSLQCRDLQDPSIEFACRGRIDDALAQEIWNNQAKYLKAKIKFKRQAQGGYDSHRIPIFQEFISFRDPIDMGQPE